MYTIGIDIGTTSICFVVADVQSRETAEQLTLPNHYNLKSAYEYEKIQNPADIYNEVLRAYTALKEKWKDIYGIGISGQMHGILYVDTEGEAVSGLYTWQDGRGEEKREGVTYAKWLEECTGYPMASGYGMVTHAYNLQNGLVPERAAAFCTIGDYIAMKLAGRKQPLMHTSNAASLGLFDLEAGEFDRRAMEKAQIVMADGLEVTARPEAIGSDRDGVPVMVALGDNQASFAGSVREVEQSVLVNVGTGSQVSVYSRNLYPVSGLEIRPAVGEGYLFCGSSLCGGRAYGILKEFFCKTAAMLGCEAGEHLFEKMADTFMDKTPGTSEKIKVRTTFCGTRENPFLRGSISNLGEHNFTPEDLIEGVLDGIAEELYESYLRMPEEVRKGKTILVGSGNGIRKNRRLQQIFEEKFGMKLHVPEHMEEAAYGAALQAASGRETPKASWDGNPVFFERNRVFRVYRGGKLFHGFFGDADVDGNMPEEWVASSVEALNSVKRAQREGISRVYGQEGYFDELLARYGEDMLGGEKEMGVLVKILDSAIRLPAQVHPTKEFSERFFHSSYGKAESWLVLDTRENACIYMGFNRRYTKEELRDALRRSEEDTEALRAMMTRVPVQKGDVFFIPAGMAHAIGSGCLILEVQEPTDFTIQPEAWCGAYHLSEYEMYLGLSQDDALDCFDLELWGEKALKMGRKAPRLLARDEEKNSEVLIGKEDTECFSLLRHQIKKTLVPKRAPAIYVVTEGTGRIRCKAFTRKLARGDYFFLPSHLSGICSIDSETGMEIVECLPPYVDIR